MCYKNSDYILVIDVETIGVMIIGTYLIFTGKLFIFKFLTF